MCDPRTHQSFGRRNDAFARRRRSKLDVRNGGAGFCETSRAGVNRSSLKVHFLLLFHVLLSFAKLLIYVVQEVHHFLHGHGKLQSNTLATRLRHRSKNNKDTFIKIQMWKFHGSNLQPTLSMSSALAL